MTDYVKYYNASATHQFIIGAVEGNRVNVYFITVTPEILAILFSDKPYTSKRQKRRKYRSTYEKRDLLKRIAYKISYIGTTEYLKSQCRWITNKDGTKHLENCGECLERLLCIIYNGKQASQSNLSHRDGGDIEIDGIAYQVKYEGGGITVEG